MYIYGTGPNEKLEFKTNLQHPGHCSLQQVHQIHTTWCLAIPTFCWGNFSPLSLAHDIQSMPTWYILTLEYQVHHVCKFQPPHIHACCCPAGYDGLLGYHLHHVVKIAGEQLAGHAGPPPARLAPCLEWHRRVVASLSGRDRPIIGFIDLFNRN